MKAWKRALAALLAAGLLAAGLSACNKAEEPTAIEKVSGLAPETTLFTVDGQPVTAADYCYWLTYNMDYVSFIFTMVKSRSGQTMQRTA